MKVTKLGWGGGGAGHPIADLILICVEKLVDFCVLTLVAKPHIFFLSPGMMLCSNFDFQNIFIFLYISSKRQHFAFATFWSFSKILATLTWQHLVHFSYSLQHFFATFNVAKNVFLQHFLMLQKKMPMLQKKKPMPTSQKSGGNP